MLFGLRRCSYYVYASIVLILVFVLQSSGIVLAGTVVTIDGYVTDESGAPIAGVSVAATSPSGIYRAKTDAHGYYAIAGVAPDTYVISFEAPGYQNALQAGVSAFADQSVRVSM